MTIEPTSSFPLLASDQAEVMRIFLELMSNHSNPAESIAKLANDKPLGPHNGSDLTR